MDAISMMDAMSRRSGGVRGPIESVAKIVEDFRASNPHLDLEHDYQEIIRKAINQSYKRSCIRDKRGSAAYSEAQPRDIDMSPAEGPFTPLRQYALQFNLAQVLLPALRGRLHFVSWAFSSFGSINEQAWYEGILNTLIEMDELLEQIQTTKDSRWFTPEPDQEDLRRMEPSSLLRTQDLLNKVAFIMRRPSAVLTACDTFLKDFSFSNPSIYNLSHVNQSNSITSLSDETINIINGLIPELQKPFLQVAKEQWQEYVVKDLHKYSKDLIDALTSSPRPNAVRLLPIELEKQLLKAAIFLIKLCRIYFNKLSRFTSGQPLIFIALSTAMGDEQLARISRSTEKMEHFTRDFYYEISYRGNPQHILTQTTALGDGFAKCLQALEKYWLALLESNDPRVDQEAISDARHWQKSWSLFFSNATEELRRIVNSWLQA